MFHIFNNALVIYDVTSFKSLKKYDDNIELCYCYVTMNKTRHVKN